MLLYWRSAEGPHSAAWQHAFGAEAQSALDRTVWLVCRALEVPVALVTLVEETRQVFQAQLGLPEPWSSRGETPLSHSFCQHCVASGRPFIVENAREHPRVADNLAITDLGVIGYLGVPLRDPFGEVIGALCAIDEEPRAWSEADRELMETLASAVEAEFRRCSEIVSMRRHLVEARQDVRAQGTFMATLGHELRALLTGITGSVDLLREQVSGDGRRLVETIDRSATQMHRFTDDILELEALARSKLRLEQAPFSPHALVRGVFGLFRDRVARGVAIRVEIAETVPAAWTGDVRRFEQVLINLASNAAKFTREGEIVLSATMEDGHLVLRVADTGPGIPEAQRSRIFSRFERGDAMVESGEPGFGLGLAICREVAERTGCDLSLERTRCPGGSVFRLAIPAPAA